VSRRRLRQPVGDGRARSCLGRHAARRAPGQDCSSASKQCAASSSRYRFAREALTTRTLALVHPPLDIGVRSAVRSMDDSRPTHPVLVRVSVGYNGAGVCDFVSRGLRCGGALTCGIALPETASAVQIGIQHRFFEPALAAIGR
jgi:hypothetical protein